MATMEQQQLEAIKELQKINNLNMFAIENGLTLAEARTVFDAMPGDEREFVPQPYSQPPDDAASRTGFVRPPAPQRHSFIGQRFGEAASSAAGASGSAADATMSAIFAGTAADVHGDETRLQTPEFYAISRQYTSAPIDTQHLKK